MAVFIKRVFVIAAALLVSATEAKVCKKKKTPAPPTVEGINKPCETYRDCPNPEEKYPLPLLCSNATSTCVPNTCEKAARYSEECIKKYERRWYACKSWNKGDPLMCAYLERK